MNHDAFPSQRSPLTDWNGRFGLPDFARIEDRAFEDGFNAGFAAHNSEITAIANNPEAPTIENTLMALDLAGKTLERVSAFFWCKAGAHTNEAIQRLEREISPRMARHYSAVAMNEALFERVNKLYRERDTLKLDPETTRALEKCWKAFVRGGARLDAVGKKRLAEVNEALAVLGAQFGQNVLADESKWALFLGESDLTGLPQALRGTMAEAAESRGEVGRFAVTLSRSVAEPFLTYSQRRDLRETVLKAFVSRGINGGEADNAAETVTG